MALPKLSRIRKALIAAVPPLLPILAYFLGVLPQAHQLLGPLVYVAILGELGAAGVYAVTNEPAPEPEKFNVTDLWRTGIIPASAEPNAKFVGGADQVVPPTA